MGSGFDAYLHPKWIEMVTAVVVLRRGCACSEQDLVDHARAELAAYKSPKKVIFADDLPRNASGMVLKRELRRNYLSAV